MSVNGPLGREIRGDDIIEGDWKKPTPEGGEVLESLASIARVRERSLLDFLDGSMSLAPLARRLAADGRLDVSDVWQLVHEAMDYDRLTAGEQEALRTVVRSHADRFTPDALEGLARFVGLALRRPGITPP